MNVFLLSFVTVMAGSAAPSTAASPACAAKRDQIEQKISEAKSSGRRHELAGLTKALQANLRHCTTATLEADRNRDIRKATESVAEREAELAEAKRKGKISKIAKQEAKLAEALKKLEAAKAPLH